MSSLRYQELSGRRRRRRRSSPLVSAVALMAIAAFLALVQSVRAEELAEGGCTVGVTMTPNVKLPKAKMDRVRDDDDHPSTDPIMRATKPTVWQVQVVYQAEAATPTK
jgi:hypothetical protein